MKTARVVKLLLLMENGIPSEFKGKSLSEIEIDTECIENNTGRNETFSA